MVSQKVGLLVIVLDTPLYMACVQGRHVASVHFKKEDGCTIAHRLESTGDPICLSAVLARVARMPGLRFTVDESNPERERLSRMYARRLKAKKIATVYEV
jgi:hypothetical protein